MRKNKKNESLGISRLIYYLGRNDKINKILWKIPILGHILTEKDQINRQKDKLYQKLINLQQRREEYLINFSNQCDENHIKSNPSSKMFKNIL